MIKPELTFHVEEQLQKGKKSAQNELFHNFHFDWLREVALPSNNIP